MNRVYQRTAAAIADVRDLPAPTDARELREQAGLSIRQFASLVGVSPTCIALWETGDRRPTGARRTAYAAALRAIVDSVQEVATVHQHQPEEG